jgi:hypothetical protein
MDSHILHQFWIGFHFRNPCQGQLLAAFSSPNISLYLNDMNDSSEEALGLEVTLGEGSSILQFKSGQVCLKVGTFKVDQNVSSQECDFTLIAGQSVRCNKIQTD